MDVKLLDSPLTNKIILRLIPVTNNEEKFLKEFFGHGPKDDSQLVEVNLTEHENNDFFVSEPRYAVSLSQGEKS